MKLKTKFICLGLALIGTALITEWLNFQSGHVSHQQKTAVELVQRHMDADMKHDGIRGNVYSALVATQTNDQALLDASREDVRRMSGEFTKDTEDNIKAEIPADIRQQFLRIQQSVAAYTNFSEKISQAPDFATADAMLPEFNHVFDVLEDDQSKATDMIMAWSAQVKAEAGRLSLMLNVAIAVLLILAVALPAFAVMQLFRPLSTMVAAMRKLSAGDTSVTIPFDGRKDEMGEIAGAVTVFKDNLLRIDTLHADGQAEKARAELEKRAALHSLADAFERSMRTAVTRVADSAASMRSSADSVNRIAEDTQHRSERIVIVSNEASETSTHMAGATEELTSSIREIGDQTLRSTQIANEAAAKADFARGVIGTLSDASERVGQIIGVITSIASQINLLALNATIESARAGEAGRGFAVVASEVKNLANQVARATGEITGQIGEMQGATQASVKAVQDILTIIHQVTESTSAVAAAVEEQASVTNEIARSVRLTSTGTQEISRNVVSVQSGAEQTGSSARQVLDAAIDLSSQSDRLTETVDEFLNRIRAG